MSEFKVGDRVRTTAQLTDGPTTLPVGSVGTVVDISGSPHSIWPYRVRLDDYGDSSGDRWFIYGRSELAPLDGLKDSGKREEFSGGGMREPETGKARFDLLVPEKVPYEEQFLTRFAVHMAKGAEKYEARNWEQFSDDDALERAKSGAFRHFMQWLTGETDEDHAAALVFNLMVVEHINAKKERSK